MEQLYIIETTDYDCDVKVTLKAEQVINILLRIQNINCPLTAYEHIHLNVYTRMYTCIQTSEAESETEVT